MTAIQNKIVRFIDWWFAETWKMAHGNMVFSFYIIPIRTFLIYYFDMDYMTYMMMDGMIFSIILYITMIGPDVRSELIEGKASK